MHCRFLALLALLTVAAAGRAATLDGRVLDATDRSAVPGARVEVTETGTAVLTDNEGRFSLKVPPGIAVTIIVMRDGFHARRTTLRPPLPAAVEIELEPLATYTDRIEVTATRAREGRDPVTFTDIPKKRIEEDYWGQDPAMLLADLAPGYNAYNDNGNGIGYSYFTIRGFGQARTRVTLNGAPLNDAESGEVFFIDLADFLSTSGDIQMQRGVFGLSGIGGAVDITTAMPGLEPSFTLLTGFGSYGTRRLMARFSSGLIDGRWALEARYSKIDSDGYRDQSWVHMWNYYIALARYGERSNLRLVLFGGPEQTHLAYDGVPRAVLDGGLSGDPDRDRRFNPLTYPGEIDNFTQPHFQLVHDLIVDPATRLSQTFFVFQGEGYYDQYKSDRNLFEYDLPDVTLPGGPVITSTDLVRRRTVDEWDAGWVPSLEHEAGNWTFAIRGEARLHCGHHWGEVKWAQFYPQGIPPDHRYYDYRVEKRVGALLGTATWTPSSGHVSVQGGLELAHRAYTMFDDELKNVAFTDAFDFLLPRLGATVHLGEGAELYANLARGMHEPAFRDIYDPQDYYGVRVSLDPEDVWDWETGVSLRRTSWRLRANLFWMDFANEIVYAGSLDENGVPVYGNGAKSRHRGVETSATWQPVAGFALDGTLTLSRNTFTRYREYGWDASVTVYDGNRIAGYPSSLATLTARWEVGPWRLLATARRVGSFYLDNSQNNRRNPEVRGQPDYVPLVNPAFATLDVAVRYELPASLAGVIGLRRAGLELRINNALDETYTAFGYVDGGEPLFMPAAGRNALVSLSLGL
jgi:iron complex outermembrane receptor protein